MSLLSAAERMYSLTMDSFDIVAETTRMITDPCADLRKSIWFPRDNLNLRRNSSLCCELLYLSRLRGSCPQAPNNLQYKYSAYSINGVSPTKHRKEHTKHDFTPNIKDNYKILEELPKNKALDSSNLKTDEYDVLDISEIMNYTTNPVTSVSNNTTFNERKSTIHKIVKQDMTKGTTKTMEINGFHQDKSKEAQNEERLRLMSESSAESDDSFAIVFETESETCTDADHEASCEDQDSDSDENLTLQDNKVQFNLTPTVHTMVFWNYAYRAARRGPWEEMARDRERFKRRINCIEEVLNPILTSQHRSYIWQERFSVTDN